MKLTARKGKVKMKRSSKNICLTITVALIFLIGLAMRLYCVFTVEYTLMTDALNYHNLAAQLASGGEFGYASAEANAYITPLYPLFMSLFYRIFGSDGGMLAVQIVQSFLGAGTAVIGYLICKRFFSRAAGVIAAVFLAFYPPFIMGSMCLLTECFYVFLFMVYLYFQLASVFRKDRVIKERIFLSAVCGMLFALCVLTRPAIFPLAVLPYGYKFFTVKHEGKKSVLFEFLAFSLGIITFMLPWWIRNAVVLGRFVLLCDQGGNPLLFGTFPNMEIPEGFYVPPELEMKTAIERIINGFTKEPIKYLEWYTTGKFRYIFFNIWYYLPGPVSMPYFRSYLYIMHFAAVVLGWFSVLYGVFSKRLRPLALYAVLLTAFQLAVIPNERYAYTILPILILLLSEVSVRCFSTLRCVRSRKEKISER